VRGIARFDMYRKDHQDQQAGIPTFTRSSQPECTRNGLEQAGRRPESSMIAYYHRSKPYPANRIMYISQMTPESSQP